MSRGRNKKSPWEMWRMDVYTEWNRGNMKRNEGKGKEDVWNTKERYQFRTKEVV